MVLPKVVFYPIEKDTTPLSIVHMSNRIEDRRRYVPINISQGSAGEQFQSNSSTTLEDAIDEIVEAVKKVGAF